MSRTWIFQANPAHYDIDAALVELSEIWWRVPQHTAEVHRGDTVVLWRSGRSAGIVGVGTVESEPQLRAGEAVDALFGLHPDEGNGVATRVLVHVAGTSFVEKNRLRSIEVLADHQILRAPMGTVFAMSPAQWTALAPMLVTPPSIGSVERSTDLPVAFAWAQRSKGVLPMPGGYDGYLRSTTELCQIVEDLHPTQEELVQRMLVALDVKETATRLRISFLRRAGIIELDTTGTFQVGPWAQRWLSTGNDDILVALLHARCQFIGELLSELQTPRTSAELLAIANERYGMGWDTLAQIERRRGWLQSAGSIRLRDDGYLVLTDRGGALLGRLTLHIPTVDELALAPAVEAPAEAPELGEAGADERPLPSPTPTVTMLADEIMAASTDSGNPNRFERAVRDAFAFLGFDAELLGGSGRTDVLLDAPIGRGESYRVAVDAKTTAGGALPDGQVDWATLVEHRGKHAANYSLLVGPDPARGRLVDRAVDHHVTVLSARQLAGLCRQHAATPLCLRDYRAVFEAFGEANTSDLDEAAQESARLVRLAATLCRTLTSRSMSIGRMSARDLWLILSTADETETTEDEIQGLLHALASPLIRAVDGDPSHGYAPAGSVEVTQLRLGLLAAELA